MTLLTLMQFFRTVEKRPNKREKKLKYGTTFQMDIGQTMNTIIQKNTQNCDCPACSRWNTRALSTLVGSMEKRGKDMDYIQRQLSTIKNKDFICENKDTSTITKKIKKSSGGVKRWRQHGHGKRIVTIPGPKYKFPIHAPGSDMVSIVETKETEKQLVMQAQPESKWREVGATRGNKNRVKSRNKSRYEHEQGIDIKEIEIKDKPTPFVAPTPFASKKKSALEQFFAKSKKKKRGKKKSSQKTSPKKSTKTWDSIKPEGDKSPTYVKEFPKIDDKVPETKKIVKSVVKGQDKFYAAAVVEHINGNIGSCSKRSEPVIVKEEDVCPFWSGQKGRDGCNFGKRCKMKHCKATCHSFISTGKCTNQYCTKLHSFIATFTAGKEASDAGNIRHKMWKARKKDKRTFSKPPQGYTCRLCGVKGHWIQQCAKAK